MDNTDYGLISAQLSSLADDTPLWLPLLSNAAALIAESLPAISWAGFYLARPGRTLILGPFQGRLACTEIPFGKGVCGTAAKADAIQVVPDVHAFPGHIACDAASASEIVVPIHADDEVVAVLDIDSPLKGRLMPEAWPSAATSSRSASCGTCRSFRRPAAQTVCPPEAILPGSWSITIATGTRRRTQWIPQARMSRSSGKKRLSF